MTQLDLIRFATRYPDAPGFKEPTTSKAAAYRIAPTAATLRRKCLETLRRCPMTADEVAGQLGESVLSIRPRISELRQSGQIKATGRRSENASGMKAHVWEVL